MTVEWCETHQMRWQDPEHKIDGHVCSLVEKEVHVA